jgi:hypothetical protein
MKSTNKSRFFAASIAELVIMRYIPVLLTSDVMRAINSERALVISRASAHEDDACENENKELVSPCREIQGKKKGLL